MTSVLVPIFICVVLPVSVVLIRAIMNMHTENKRSEVLLKAIEANNSIDADKLAQALAKPRPTPRELLNLRLLRGCLFGLIGLGLMIAGLIGLANNVPFESDPVSVPLIFGASCLAIGLSYIIVYFATRKQVDDEKKED